MDSSIPVFAEGDADIHEAQCGSGPFDVRVHQCPTRPSYGANAVSHLGRCSVRLLQMAGSAALEARHGRRQTPRADPGVVHGEPGYLRRPAGLLGSSRGGRDLQHRVARLMREHRLRALHGYRSRRWTVGTPAILIPNLLQRKFTVARRNVAWVTDITYIRTWQGWLYLAVVMDLFSRRIVGWAAGPTVRAEMVLDAVLMAVRARRPRGTVIHSDQGTQYGSDAWRRFCRSKHLVPSMSQKGNRWDNAVAESFFRSLQKELVKEADLQEPRDRGECGGRLHRSLLQSHPPTKSPRRCQPRTVRSDSQRSAQGYPLNPGISIVAMYQNGC